MTRRKLSLALVVLLLIGVGLVVVEAQEDENAPYLDYRQRLMKGQGASMGSIGDYLKNRLDYGSEHIATHASNIAGYAKLIPDAFEKEITQGKTDAKPEVWSNWDDFVSKANALESAANELASAASGGNLQAMMPKVQALGDACGSCHDVYRKPQEERFPR